VAAVIDLFSRRVVGWSMSAGITAQLVTDALVMAIWRRGKADVFDYIELFYNSRRKHSTIGYLSPTEFARKAGFA
jgi:transposase InsO family protein